MRLSMMGVDLDLVTMDELVSTVTEEWPPGARAVIAHQNLHGVYLSHRDPGMRQLAARASLVHIDGMALVYLARLLGHPARPEHRSTYMDLVWPLLAACEARGRRVFYLGGRPGVAEEAARRVRERHPELQIETHHGFFAKHGTENRRVLDRIAEFGPNVLMVGMGMPLQENWILDNLPDLEADVILPSGACFDYLAGEIPIPPRWMGRVGLEWLYRLGSEPRRLWRRYLVEPWFVAGLALKEFVGPRTGD